MQNKPKTTLSYLVKDGKFLMIQHKRGRGKGYFNFPGGKQDKGENIVQTAIRETFEETDIKTKNLKLLGKLDFNFPDGRGSVGHVFTCEYESGELKPESDEVLPIWLDEIPTNKMWDADKYWIEMLRMNQKFFLSVYFDENNKVTKLEVLDVDF